jgi:hypothetical protein
MTKAAIGEIQRGAAKSRDAARSNPWFRLRTLTILVLPVALWISGCAGVTGAPSSAASGQQNQSMPAGATISVLPSSITFGSVAVNGTASQSITVSNGGGSDLIVTQASIATAGFAVTGASFPMTIAAGHQANLNIVFSPKTVGSDSGMLSVMSSASGSPVSVAVSGSAVASAALLNSSASSLSFGNVSAGAKGTVSVTLSNAGSSNVTISSVSLSGPSLTVSGVSAGLILTPGQSATLNVTFSPTAAGNLAGSVTVASNASNSPAIVALSGTSTQQAVSHSATLAWSASTSIVAGYNVYRSSVDGGPYAKLNASLDSGLNYTDSSVAAGNTYFYVVTSVNSSGVESANSTVASAVVPTQ